MDFQKYTQGLLNKGFVVFSSYVQYINGHKQLFNPKGYNEYTTTPIECQLKEDKNTLMMRMGVEYQPNKFIILIDIDNKETDDIQNGNKLWDLWNVETNTIKEVTPSNGFHYYFYVTKEQAEYLKCSKTTLTYNDITYAVDYKFTNQMSAIAPSHYMKNGKTVFYEYVGKTFLTGMIEKIPDVIFETLKSQYINKIMKHVKHGTPVVKVDKEFKEICSLEQITKYMKFIGKYDDYTRWRDLGYILKNLNQQSLSIYIYWSKQSTKYESSSLIRAWNSHKPNNGLSINSLINYVREDKIEGFESVLTYSDLKKAFDTIKLETRYLTASTQVMEIVDNWMNNEKFLSILSPYDTGKTTLIKNILDKYKCETVLYITYRQSLARTFHSAFKVYQFKNYLNKDFTGDRQIIQLDSLLKIPFTQYDLVIIDEIESVLAHMSSDTIQKKTWGEGEVIYNKLCEIINDSSHILALDGDYNNRAHIFLSQFEHNVNVIENTIKLDIKHFYEENDRVVFNKKLKTMVKDEKKVVIVCMSANDVENYSEMFNKYNVKKYTSRTDDKAKKLENIQDEWLCDVLIYSPTIESGVDFNVSHFDNLFVVYSQFSTCPRGLNQMMNRVRKFKSNDITVLFENIPKNDVGCSTLDEVIDNYKVELHKSELSSYNLLKCYNTLEHNNSIKNFYNEFLTTIYRKGHSFISLKNKSGKKAITPNLIKIDIYKANMINYETFNKLLKKQKVNDATQEEKYQIEKFLYCQKLGISTLSFDTLEQYYNKLYLFDNHMSIIDIRNIKYFEMKDKGDFDTNKTIKLCECAHNIIHDLGFKHCYDKSIIEAFDINVIMEHVKTYRKLTLNKETIKDTLRAQLGAVNQILHEYGISVVQKRTNKRIEGVQTHRLKYTLETIKDLDKYVCNRVQLGMKIKDKHNIINTITEDTF